MEITREKKVCATCADWQGPRQWSADGTTCQVSSGAKGRCDRHQKLKPIQGGCADWTPAASAADQD